MAKSNTKKLLSFITINDNFGFGLVDAIVSMSLLTGVITYGIYFSSLRLGTVYNTNLTTSINKEIERDIERLKSDFWGMYFEGSPDTYYNDPNKCEYSINQNSSNNGEKCTGEYCLANGDRLCSNVCADFTDDILDLDSWKIQENSSNLMIQSWKPSSKRSKVFTGQPVTISREISVNSPLDEDFLNKTIASISYRVIWSDKNIHWLSILMSPEAHSWCEDLI